MRSSCSAMSTSRPSRSDAHSARQVGYAARMIDYTLDNIGAVVRMDDGKANALSYEMIDALLDALDRAEAEASAMVLAGRTERFCAGFDLRIMMSGMEAATKLLTRGVDLLMRLYATPVPLVI